VWDARVIDGHRRGWQGEPKATDNAKETAMLRKEQNELLTRTGAETPMGEMFRRYWIPALLAEELPENVMERTFDLVAIDISFGQ
jgi:hypothetical protein